MSESLKQFSDFPLAPSIQANIAKMGYVNPTPVQVQAIPVVLAGQDVMAAAQTGTGKTAGYGLPTLQRILSKANRSMSPARHPVRILILTPTRELADQVNVNLEQYAAGTGLRVATVYGGVDIKPQAEILRRGVEVLTATPGRLLDHVQGRSVNLSQVETVILDEADRMLDMGFLPDISRILNLLPVKRQSLMFSATFSPEIKKLAASFLKNPVLIEVARENATADTVSQVLYEVRSQHKVDVLIDLLKRGPETSESMKQVIVFVNSKLMCRRLASTLQRVGIKADSIHGDKTQDERMHTLEAFKTGECEVLVATDVAARGIDIADLPCVINFDVPFNAEDYVHRIGRTGRAGAQGQAYMLVTEDDAKLVDEIEKLIGRQLSREKKEPLSREERRINGENRRRGGSSEGSERGERIYRERDRGSRVALEIPTMRKVQYDPIFDRPYDEVVSESPVQVERPPLPDMLQRKKKKTPLAALLGGIRKID